MDVWQAGQRRTRWRYSLNTSPSAVGDCGSITRQPACHTFCTVHGVREFDKPHKPISISPTIRLRRRFFRGLDSAQRRQLGTVTRGQLPSFHRGRHTNHCAAMYPGRMSGRVQLPDTVCRAESVTLDWSRWPSWQYELVTESESGNDSGLGVGIAFDSQGRTTRLTLSIGGARGAPTLAPPALSAAGGARLAVLSKGTATPQSRGDYRNRATVARARRAAACSPRTPK